MLVCNFSIRCESIRLFILQPSVTWSPCTCCMSGRGDLLSLPVSHSKTNYILTSVSLGVRKRADSSSNSNGNRSQKVSLPLCVRDWLKSGWLMGAAQDQISENAGGKKPFQL